MEAKKRIALPRYEWGSLLKSCVWVPGNLGKTFAVVEVSGKSEKEVAKAVDEDEQHGVDGSLIGEVEHTALAAARHGAAHVGKSR